MIARTWLLLLSCAALGWSAELCNGVSQGACHTGGFTLLRSDPFLCTGDEVKGKADSTFNVTLDIAYYQNNGFDESLRSAMTKWSSVSGSNWKFNFTGYG